MVVKYAIANISPRKLAELGQAKSALDGSVYGGYGFGYYGVEETTFLEIAVVGNDPISVAMIDAFVITVLQIHGEKSAYRTIDGKDASLVYADGRVEAL